MGSIQLSDHEHLLPNGTWLRLTDDSLADGAVFWFAEFSLKSTTNYHNMETSMMKPPWCPHLLTPRVCRTRFEIDNQQP